MLYVLHGPILQLYYAHPLFVERPRFCSNLHFRALDLPQDHP